MSEERTEQLDMPVLPLRDVVVYPHMVFHCSWVAKI